MRAPNYPKHLLVTTNTDMKSDAVMASSRPLASLRESVDHFLGTSHRCSPCMSQLIGASSEMSVERRGVAEDAKTVSHIDSA